MRRCIVLAAFFVLVELGMLSYVHITTVHDTDVIEPVDLSEKLVCVDVEVSPEFAPLAPRVYELVEAFYRPYGVRLRLRSIDSLIDHSADAKLVIVLPYEGCCTAVAKDGTKSKISGIGMVEEGLVLMNDDREIRFGRRLTDDEAIRSWSSVLAHELGHIVGLVHPDESDLGGLELAFDGKPNLMNHQVPFLDEAALSPPQQLRMHDCLSGAEPRRHESVARALRSCEHVEANAGNPLLKH